ncbi:MAG: hypothetical protein IPN20_09815 [Haliscomenobacter sp.]|nr:hypothetical protein [Haliscomenobacter sp.]
MKKRIILGFLSFILLSGVALTVKGAVEKPKCPGCTVSSDNEKNIGCCAPCIDLPGDACVSGGQGPACDGNQ